MEIQKNASIIGWPLSSASVAAHARNMQPLFLMRNRKLFDGSDAAVPCFLEMSYCKTRTKNIVGFEEN